MSKFHINNKGEAKPCNAKIRGCRFGGDFEHFDTLEEATSAAENKMIKNERVFNKISKNSLKDKNTELLSEIDKYFNHDIKLQSNDVEKLKSYLKNFTPDNLVHIGKIVDEELNNRLPFDMLEKDLSYDDLELIEAETHKLMNEITASGEGLNNQLYGSLSTELNNAVKVLPNNVKNKLSNTPILAKATRIDNNQFDGQHMANAKFNTYVKSTGKKIDDFEKERTNNIPDNTIYIDDFVFTNEMGAGWGSRASIKKEGNDIYEEVWIGEGLSTQNRGKKISDSAKVFYNGKLQTIDKPVFEIKDSITLTGSVILSKKKDSSGKPNSSVLLHEYVHLVQYEDNSCAESRMVHELKEEEYYDESLNLKCYKGFPDEYMGLSNGRELLTRASEGLYYPSNNSYLYGKHKGKNADKVRQWIMGYWIAKNKS